ncbi:MAG: S8 family serine peptidase [Bacteroidales bacterium]|nr:S8 family serine peptidase [Bacteroidales bacterium]
MKKLFLSFLLLGFVTSVAQNVYYYSGNRKIYLNTLERAYVVQTEDAYNYNNNVLNEISYTRQPLSQGEAMLITIKSSVIKPDSVIKTLFSNVIPAKQADGLEFFFTGELLLKVTQGYTIQDVINFTNGNTQLKNDDGLNCYVLDVIDWDSIFSVSNKIYESGLVDYCHPNFLSPFVPTSMYDPLYYKQFYLNNYSGIDINAPEAWALLGTQKKVRIGVVDCGVEDHEDLYNKVLQGKTMLYSNQRPNTYGRPCSVPHPHDPSIQNRSTFYHGTACAGIIAAEHGNAKGIKGIINNSEIVPFNVYNDWYVETRENAAGILVSKIKYRETIREFAQAIRDAWDTYDCDIISNSWVCGPADNDYNYADKIQDEITNALTLGRDGYGTVVVFSAGNNYQTYYGVSWPANIDGVIAVGSIDTNGVVSYYSNRGIKLSVVAPSSNRINNITTLDRMGSAGQELGNYYDYFGGTSAACPQVAGVAALLLSSKPSLTAQSVKNIIEETAKRIHPNIYPYSNTSLHPNGLWNDSVGYGLVDAYAALKKAMDFHYNLYTRDNPSDDGSEPVDPIDGITNSPDIWLRNYQDGDTIHQLMLNGTNYLYATIHNLDNGISTDTSWINDSIRFFVKRTSLDWRTWRPDSWTELAVAPLPRIAPGSDTTICIPVNNNGLIVMNTNYALYSRIESPFDTLKVSEITVVGRNVEDNNNISFKNVYITNYYISSNHAALDAFLTINAISPNNPYSGFRLNFNVNDLNILNEAEVTIVFPEDLMTDWTPSSESLKQITANTYLVIGETVELTDIPETEVTLRYNFLTRRNEPEEIYKSHVTQFVGSGEDEEIIGGLTIQIEKPERATEDRFTANAGNDTAVLLNTTATLHATQINENATYRWYDKQRNFLYEGVNYSATPTQTSEYILEVTAESDGYRDLDTVKVTVVPGCIRSITPNPVSDNWITVSYEYATTVTSAQLLIYNTATTTLVGNYDLSNLGNASSLDIEVTTYPTGSYTVVLVCDNAVCHSKVLIRQ